MEENSSEKIVLTTAPQYPFLHQLLQMESIISSSTNSL